MESLLRWGLIVPGVLPKKIIIVITKDKTFTILEGAILALFIFFKKVMSACVGKKNTKFIMQYIGSLLIFD
jgi:hypothetical protein